MRHSLGIGIALYVAVVSGVIGGAYAAFEATIGSARAQTVSHGVVKQGAGAPHHGKWTPVEIKRRLAQLPPLPAYVTPSGAARARAAKKVQKNFVLMAHRAPTDVQRVAYVPAASAYVPVKETHSFGPFIFKF